MKLLSSCLLITVTSIYPDFVKSISNSGSYVRKEPSSKSQKIGLMPYLTVTRFSARSGKLETIGGKPGEWLRVEINGQIGYIFDAFAAIVPENHEMYDYSQFDITRLESRSKKFLSDNAKWLKKSGENSFFDFFSLKLSDTNPGCEKQMSYVVFVNKASGLPYYSTKIITEQIRNTQLAIPNAVTTSYQGCSCCDGDPGQYTYVMTNEDIVRFRGPLENQKGTCYWSGELGRDAEVRVSTNGKGLYFSLRRMPWCDEFNDHRTYASKTDKIRYLTPTNYENSTFLEIDISANKIKYREIKKSYIPAEFADYFR